MEALPVHFCNILDRFWAPGPVGTGQDLTILDLAKKIADIIGFKGEIKTKKELPDGTPRKLLDVNRIKRLGWMPSIKLDDGLRETYDWFLSNESEYRSV